jgi:pyridoxamine 5'-phosphate oxidase
LEDRADLMRRFAEAQAEFADREVPVPDSWTGYLVVPERMEFWHGRPDRLNERLRYRREGEQWVLERLQP